MIGSSGRHPRRGAGGAAGGAGGLLKRPRFVGTLLFVALVTLILLPDGNRSRAHSALSKAGVPLPDELPDRLQGFIDYLNRDDGSNDLRYTPPPAPPVEEEDFGLPESELETVHRFQPNGQMYVEPLSTFKEAPAPHPILTLIKRAENDWNRKVKRQSKNLREAVKEYRIRYKRNPPRGFEKWWAYAKANRVILTDEYDQIHRDMEPFWSLYASSFVHSPLSFRTDSLPLAATLPTSSTAFPSCKTAMKPSRFRSRMARRLRSANRRSSVAPRTSPTSSLGSALMSPTST
jgi:hypothetical protein